MSETEQRLDGIEGRLASLEQKLAASEDVLELAARKAQEIVEDMIAQLDLDGLSDRVALAATQPIMKAVDSRLKKLKEQISQTGAVDSAGAASGTDPAALAALSERLDQLEAATSRSSVELSEEFESARLDALTARLDDLEQRLQEVRSAGGGPAAPPLSGAFDKKFVALAREVKNLKDNLGAGSATGSTRRFAAAAAEEGQSAPDAVAMLNSPEFKELFDQRINQVLGYVKSDLVPSAVRRALSETEA